MFTIHPVYFFERYGWNGEPVGVGIGVYGLRARRLLLDCGGREGGERERGGEREGRGKVGSVVDRYIRKFREFVERGKELVGSWCG